MELNEVVQAGSVAALKLLKSKYFTFHYTDKVVSKMKHCMFERHVNKNFMGHIAILHYRLFKQDILPA